MFPAGTFPGSSRSPPKSWNHPQTMQSQPPPTSNYLTQISLAQLNSNFPPAYRNQIPTHPPIQYLTQIPFSSTPTPDNAATTDFSQPPQISHPNETEYNEEMSTEQESNANQHPWQKITKKRKFTRLSKSTEDMSEIITTNKYQVLTETEPNVQNINNSNATNVQTSDPNPPPVWSY